MSDDARAPLALRLAAVGHPLVRSATADADWVSSAARRPGADVAALAERIGAPPGVAEVESRAGLMLVRVTDAALVADLGVRAPAVAVAPPAHPDVPSAFAAATGGAVSRFAARDLRNPAYAALVVRDRARRGVLGPTGRTLAVDLADLPRALAEHDAGRRHRLVEWIERTARQALAGPGGIPLDGRVDVGQVLADRMTTALRTLGVPDIDRI